MDADDKLESRQIPTEIDIHYKKAVNYRIIKADGAWAGITPQLDIQFALYNDLQPMPSRIRHKVSPEGALLPIELEREVEVGIAREVIATVVMNPIVAMQFVRILQTMIQQVRSDVDTMDKPTQEVKNESE
jgi:hypothetical protein